MLILVKGLIILSTVLLFFVLFDMRCIVQLRYLKRRYDETLESESLMDANNKDTAFEKNGIIPISDYSEDNQIIQLNNLEVRRSPVSENAINYADEMLGAYIEDYDAILARPRILLDWFGFKNNDNAPEELIRGSMEPGACFAFKQAHHAIVTIVLAEPIFIEAVELNHIPKYVSPSKSIENAPRHFSVYAICAEEAVHLGDFEFENIVHFQIFPVLILRPCQRVRVHFTSNHGHPETTCVYKLAVYGRRLNTRDLKDGDIFI